jgi:hypothetical protein
MQVDCPASSQILGRHLLPMMCVGCACVCALITCMLTLAAGAGPVVQLKGSAQYMSLQSESEYFMSVDSAADLSCLLTCFGCG